MDLLQGTLDMLVLRTLLSGPLHGYGIAKNIRSTSNEALAIEFGSLYPALKRLEAKGWIASGWETSEHNRRAKYYKLTPVAASNWYGNIRSGPTSSARSEGSWARCRRRKVEVEPGQAMIWNRLKYLSPAWRRREEREMREELGALTAIAGTRELGNLTLAMEDVRATWGWTWLDSLIADIRYSLRALRKQPALRSGGGGLAGAGHRHKRAPSSVSPTRCCCGPCRSPIRRDSSTSAAPHPTILSKACPIRIIATCATRPARSAAWRRIP